MIRARVLVTADDAGQSNSVDAAIIRLAERGVLTRVSAFSNFNRLSRLNGVRHLGLELGIHFNISSGRPLASPDSVPSLVNAQGWFHSPTEMARSDRNIELTLAKYTQMIAATVAERDMLLELSLQCESFERITGTLPKFATVHHDLDRDSRLANILRRGFPHLPTRQEQLRTKQLAAYLYQMLEPSITVQQGIDVVLNLIQCAVDTSRISKGRPVEVVCHPGFQSEELDLFSVYSIQRETEFRAWNSPAVKARFADAKRFGQFWEF